MTRKGVWLCMATLLLSVSPGSAENPGLRGSGASRPEGTRVCGHAKELEVAKRALAEGDREGALRHLQRARGLLAACQRNAVNPEPEWESTTSPRAFAKARAESDGSLASRSGRVPRSG